MSEIGIPFDGVRPKAVAGPQFQSMPTLIRFPAVMGPLPCAFDLLTFVGLSLVFRVAAPEFRTAWFLESMAMQILVIFVIRTNGRSWADLPPPALAMSSLGALVAAMVLPSTPVGGRFGFIALPLIVVASLAGFTYLVLAELLKIFLFDHCPNNSVHR